MSTETVEKESRYILKTYHRAPFVLVRGEGMFVSDSEGREYLDFTSGIAVTALGHSHPALVAAVTEQMGTLNHVCNLYHTVPHADLAESLCELSFADKVFLCNSGTEANEAAFKFARKYARTVHGPDKTEIIVFSGGFHGRTMGALSLTARESYQAPFRPLVEGVRVAAFNDLESVERLIGPETCALFVEPIQGEGGVNVAEGEFLEGLRALCDRWGALLVVDEIQSGMGRTGTLWAYEGYGIRPDIMTLAKALGGGFPVGATLLTDAVADCIAPGDHGSTFAGGPVVCRAAGVVLDAAADEATLAHIREMGDYLRTGIESLGCASIVAVRGRGLMLGVELDRPAAPLIEAGYEQGVMMLPAGGNVLRLLPPYIVQKEHIDRLLGVLKIIL